MHKKDWPWSAVQDVHQFPKGAGGHPVVSELTGSALGA